MAKASIVSAQQQQLLREINGKLDLLLKNAGLTYDEAAGAEAPKPIKTYIGTPPPPTPIPAPAEEKSEAKGSASKRKTG